MAHHRTTPHCTAPHPTGDSTAQHSTAPHRTGHHLGPDRTALHRTTWAWHGMEQHRTASPACSVHCQCDRTQQKGQGSFPESHLNSAEVQISAGNAPGASCLWSAHGALGCGQCLHFTPAAAHTSRTHTSAAHTNTAPAPCGTWIRAQLPCPLWAMPASVGACLMSNARPWSECSQG